MNSGWLLAVAGLGLLGGLAAALRAPRLWLVLTVLGAAAAFGAGILALCNGAPAWDWQPKFAVCGAPVHLRLDALSAFFLLLVSLVGGAATIYSMEYWNDVEHPRSARVGRVWWNALLLGLILVLITTNGLHFLVGWEIFTVSAYFLITLDRQRPEARAAGWLYLAASHVAVLCLFAFFAILAARTGSWEFNDLRGHGELAPLFWLALVGFGLKAGLFPLHVWLPSAHANAPSHVSAMLSGVTLKIGIYGLVRFSGCLEVPDSAGWVVAILGAASAVLGVAFALGQHDYKRLLAYHSVENIGIILLGLGFAMIAANHGNALWGQLALAGGLLHVWNHGLFKSLLFFGAGSVLHSTGTREMSRLGGLWRAMPWTTSLFALGAAAISGLPPLNGFVSEWLVYLGLFSATTARSSFAWAAMAAAIALAITGALALACFVKVCGVIFLGAPRSEAALRAHECGVPMKSGMLLLAVGCAAIGLAPALFWPAVVRAVEVWQPAWPVSETPTLLRPIGMANVALAIIGVAAAIWLWRRVGQGRFKRAVTWDCGYAFPTARMQYTAGSFAGIINAWFAGILRPARKELAAEGILPESASLEEHTPETVLDYAVEPAAGLTLRIVQVVRRLQHGRAQAYLFYILAGLAALALVVVESAK